MLLANARRLVRVARVVTLHGLAHLVWRWRRGRTVPPGVVDRFLPGTGLSPPERLRVALEDLGGTFIKFGQMLALQPDILPLDYCNALFSLLDRVAPFPYSDVERVCREDLGGSPHELFDDFDREPIATASIGQVHVAWRDGQKVAVKVQRPNVEVEFGSDVRLMLGAVAWIRRLRIARLYWMIEPMSEFARWTREELDYRNEARYMERLRTNAADNPHEVVPAVLAELTTRRVLTAEFLPGTTVLDYLRAVDAGDELRLRRLQEGGFDREAFARHLIDNFLGDAFRHGIFHADLHPANLMILPRNAVGYIDFGITGVLSHYSRYHLVSMTLAYTRGDTEAMADAFLRVSATEPGADTAAFRDGLRRYAVSWYGRPGAGTRLRKNFTLVMLDMLHLSRATGIWPERDVIKYIRSAIAIDGLITRLAPEFDLGAHLERSCARALDVEARQDVFEPERLLTWSTASARLMRTGAFRAAAALHQWAAPEPARRAAPRPRRRADRQRALHLSALALALAALMTVTGADVVPAVNLFTAEAALAAAALLTLVRTLYRLG